MDSMLVHSFRYTLRFLKYSKFAFRKTVQINMVTLYPHALGSETTNSNDTLQWGLTLYARETYTD